MPRSLSAGIDALVYLALLAAFVVVLCAYNRYMAGVGLLVWMAVALFSWERCLHRKQTFDSYCQNVIRNVSDMLNYAIEGLPQAVFIVDREGRVQWTNHIAAKFLGHEPQKGLALQDSWPNILISHVWGQTGEYVFAHEDKYFKARYRPVMTRDDPQGLMAFYIEDHTDYEELRVAFKKSRVAMLYIQVDNIDEVLQGLSEVEKTALLFEVNRRLDEWMKSLGGFMRRVSDELYIAVLEREMLERAIGDHFDILDKMRTLQSSNRLAVTLSMGVAVAQGQTMEALGQEAQARLDLALGRGGDQVAVEMDGKSQFFGGKAKAVEKHTRVKARVVAHAVREIIENADEVFIMGHHNEDFDCFGASVGVAKMARQLKKPAHIVLSDMNDGIEKILTLMKKDPLYDGLFVHADNFNALTALKPALFVVDTHIPHLVAAPNLLKRAQDIVVIDHHRRSGDSFIESPLLVYIEPAASSTSELITELLMYFSENLTLGRLDATALYSGIVVDTKNFAVQTGVRTFDAAAFLRRSGADPVMIRHLFRTDYDTERALSKAKASSQLYPGGLIVTAIRETIPNIQAIAGQVADSLLRIEDVRMSLVLFQLTADTVGVSARSTGEINVQVIMEGFGGGGHQNVAGTQIKGEPLDSLMKRVLRASQDYMEENEEHESHLTARR